MLYHYLSIFDSLSLIVILLLGINKIFEFIDIWYRNQIWH